MLYITNPLNREDGNLIHRKDLCLLQKSLIHYPVINLSNLDDLGLTSIPEIVYGHNFLQMTHLDSGLTLFINAKEGLKYMGYENRKSSFHDYTKNPETNNLASINYIPEDIKVAISKDWKKTQTPDDVEVDTEYKFTSDWTFTTPYKGTYCTMENFDEAFGSAQVRNFNPENKYMLAAVNGSMPKGKLGTDNPILQFYDLFLYEDDLGDFGQAQFRVRCRVMKDCAFVLLRSFLRNDNSLVRIYDTRIYIDFEADHVFREFSVRENTYDELKLKDFEFTPQFNLSPDASDMIFPKLDVKFQVSDKLVYK